MTVIYHPETGGMVDVHPDSLPHYRQSGWVTRDEWEASQAAETSPAPAASASPAASTPPARKAPDKEK